MKKSFFLGLALLAASAQVQAEIYRFNSAEESSNIDDLTIWETSDGSPLSGTVEDYWVGENNIMYFGDYYAPYQRNIYIGLGTASDPSTSDSLSIGGITTTNGGEYGLLSQHDLDYSIRLKASDDADVDTSTGGVLGANNLISSGKLYIGSSANRFKTVQMDADVNAVGGWLHIYADTISTNGGEAKTFSANGCNVELYLRSGTDSSISWTIDNSAYVRLNDAGSLNSGGMSICRTATNTNSYITFKQNSTSSAASISNGIMDNVNIELHQGAFEMSGGTLTANSVIVKLSSYDSQSLTMSNATWEASTVTGSLKVSEFKGIQTQEGGTMDVLGLTLTNVKIPKLTLSESLTLNISLSDAELLTLAGLNDQFAIAFDLDGGTLITDALSLNDVRINILNESGTTVLSSYAQGTSTVNGSLAFYYIPEPSTATLSLLSLAGLMLRRRRKAA